MVFVGGVPPTGRVAFLDVAGGMAGVGVRLAWACGVSVRGCWGRFLKSGVFFLPCFGGFGEETHKPFLKRLFSENHDF